MTARTCCRLVGVAVGADHPLTDAPTSLDLHVLLDCEQCRPKPSDHAPKWGARIDAVGASVRFCRCRDAFLCRCGDRPMPRSACFTLPGERGDHRQYWRAVSVGSRRTSASPWKFGIPCRSQPSSP